MTHLKYGIIQLEVVSEGHLNLPACLRKGSSTPLLFLTVPCPVTSLMTSDRDQRPRWSPPLIHQNLPIDYPKCPSCHLTPLLLHLSNAAKENGLYPPPLRATFYISEDCYNARSYPPSLSHPTFFSWAMTSKTHPCCSPPDSLWLVKAFPNSHPEKISVPASARQRGCYRCYNTTIR